MPRIYRRNFWRPTRWRQQRWRRRRYRRFWNPRKTFRRRWSTYRKRLRVRKKPKRKLKYLLLKEFQPQNIKKCKIKGILTLFACGPHRLNREYSGFMNSFFPELHQGGGGWSAFKFTLESLFEQRELLRNYWTQSNVQLPLVRYTGCKFRFYRTENVDYVCHYTVCLPMKVSVYDFTSAQPSNMLMKKHKIIVPSRKTNPHRRPYITKRIKSAELFQNKWYFQADLYKTPFVVLITSACCLDRISLNPKAVNSNISLNILNLDLFKAHNFQNIPVGTIEWGPKPGYWLYATPNGDSNPKISSLIFLGQTKYYTTGRTINNTSWEDYKKNPIQNYGNIFHNDYITHTKGLFIAEVPPSTLFSPTHQTYRNQTITQVNASQTSWKIAVLTQPIYITVRYTPERDKGLKNSIYLVKDTDIQNNWDPPEDEQLTYSGFPLWCLLWGWTDWVIKIKSRSQIEETHILVIKTDMTYPQKETLVLLDQTFIDGNSPWQQQHLTPTDSQSWHPKLKFQEREIATICETGPFTAKTDTTSIEAHCEYRFYLKWGGCTTDIQNITDPGEQPHFPVPNNFLQGPEIQDPASDPKNELWDFDYRRQIITKKAADRIKKDFSHEKITVTGSKLSADTKRPLSSPEETPTPEETETTPEQQLQLLRNQQQQLRKQLRKLLKTTPNFKYSDL
nr:MAG: ORF1 [TTV-like mini virus]